MRRLLIGASISVVLMLNINCVFAAPLNIDAADGYILLEPKSGQVLCEKNADNKLYPASTTKIMTAIIAIENGDANKIVTISDSAINLIGPGGMHIGTYPGEEIHMGDLISAMLIASANETAYAIAESIGGSVDGFVDIMNKKAMEIGATNTNFVNPCGMDIGEKGAKHLTTARDLAKMASYAMKLQPFRDAVGKKGYVVPPTNKHIKGIPIITTNKLLSDARYKSSYYTNITGVKTGYTDRAGHNLVSSAVNQQGTELLAVILGVRNHGNDKIFEYSKQMLEYGFKNFALQKVVNKGQLIKSVQVDNAKDGRNTVDMVAVDDLSAMLPIDTKEWALQQKEYIRTPLRAPIKKGEVLGYIEYSQNGIYLGKVDVAAQNSVGGIGYFVVGLLRNKVVLTLMTIFATFFMLRVSLRRISRAVRSKRLTAR